MTAGPSLAGRSAELVLRRLGAVEDEWLAGVRESLEAVLECGVPGDLLATGSSFGTAAVYARALLAANHVKERWIWLASPAGDSSDYDAVRAGLEACDLLDDVVRFVRGTWADALAVVPFERLALVHLAAGSGDAVEFLLGELYPRASSGAFVLVDEYDSNVDCRNAVKRFRRIHGIESPLCPFGAGGVVWRKERA